MRKVLGIPAFRRLALATLINELAFMVAEIALALLVYRRTGSAIGATAFFLCAQFAPALISPLVIARLDESSSRRALVLLYALEAVVFLLLAELISSLAVPLILLLGLIQGSLAVSARVLARTAWTSITKTEGVLRDAGALLNSVASVFYLVGPAIGGGLVALGGTRLPLFVDAGMVVVSISAVASAGELPPAALDRLPLGRRVHAALSFVREDVVVRRLLLLQAIFMIFFTISIPVEVVFARHTLHTGAGGYGLLLSAWGGGAIVGSSIYVRWRGLSSRLLMTVGAALVGVGYLPMALAPDLAVAIGGAAVAGTGNGIQIVAMRTALQESAPSQSMALILSLNESMFQALPGIGILAGGAITALAGPRTAFGVGAAGALAIAVAMWVALPSLGVERASTAEAADSSPDEQMAVSAPRS